jgi:thymidylate synthase
VQWRSWPTLDGGHIDQIAELIENLKSSSDSRQHIVSGWNVSELNDMVRPPCHAFFQFYVANGNVSCLLYQRSADMFLGVPFNIAFYALLTCRVAQQVGLVAGEFVWTGGDVHIYENHMDQVLKRLEREPYEYPQLKNHPQSGADLRLHAGGLRHGGLQASPHE